MVRQLLTVFFERFFAIVLAAKSWISAYLIRSRRSAPNAGRRCQRMIDSFVCTSLGLFFIRQIARNSGTSSSNLRTSFATLRVVCTNNVTRGRVHH